MLTKRISPIALAACSLILAGTGVSAYSAQKTETYPANSPVTTDTNQASGMHMDHAFAQKAAQGDLAEVKLGQLAEKKGTTNAVKSFGRRMVQDHSKVNEQLKSVASRDNIALPSTPSTEDQTQYERLSKLSGPEFDRAYARAMVADHTKDISEFKKEAANGNVQNIKQFASSTLPILDEHLKLARQMEQSVSGANEKGSIGQ